MRIYLLRHGVAAARDPRKYPRDIERPLTRDGRERLRRAARGMKALGLRFDLILTSPLARARQTARIVATEMKGPRAIRILRPLAPGGGLQDVVDGISREAGVESALLVGHEPGLSRLASGLLARTGVDLPLELKKGGLCRIDFDGDPLPGAGRLVFLLPPRVLRLLS